MKVINRNYLTYIKGYLPINKVYVKYLPYYLKYCCELVLFANITSLFSKVDHKQPVFHDANRALNHVLNWFPKNNLVLK